MSKNDPKKVPENEPLKNDEGPSEDYIDYRNLKTGDYELHVTIKNYYHL